MRVPLRQRVASSTGTSMALSESTAFATLRSDRGVHVRRRARLRQIQGVVRATTGEAE
jgi:hypothetical protein